MSHQFTVAMFSAALEKTLRVRGSVNDQAVLEMSQDGVRVNGSFTTQLDACYFTFEQLLAQLHELELRETRDGVLECCVLATHENAWPQRTISVGREGEEYYARADKWLGDMITESRTFCGSLRVCYASVHSYLLTEAGLSVG
jgi:hypothetical protein